MAYVTSNRGPITLPHWMRDVWQSMMDRVERRRVYVHTLSELDRLSDAELFDIGLTKTAIRTVAYEAAYGA